MDKYIEAYGAIYKKLFFFAIRFRKSILKVKIQDSSENINTSDILVLYSKKPIYTETNTLTYVVNTHSSSTKSISVQTGHTAELLLSLLNKHEILYYYFHKSVLYACGTPDAITCTYKIIPKTKTFKALYQITKAYQNQSIHLTHFIQCHYFKRNNLKWEKWNSWWYFIKNLINIKYKERTGTDITLQICNRIRKMGNCPNILQSKLNFCEIGLDETDTPGILCASENSKICYVSPMIISGQFYNSLPIKDKNNIMCNLWFPLYTNKDQWLNNSIYFYLKQLLLNINHIKRILEILKNTTVEKYKQIEENIIIINGILNNV